MTWNDDKEAEFRRLWSEGKSASEIAEKLDTTRSAVCGKARRLKLAARRRPNAPPRAARTSAAAPKLVVVPARQTGKSELTRQIKAAVPRQKTLPGRGTIPAPVAARKADGTHYGITDLTNRTCRWPIGAPADEGFHFCGNPTHQDRYYCLHHAVESVVPLHNRKAGKA